MKSPDVPWDVFRIICKYCKRVFEGDISNKDAQCCAFCWDKQGDVK